MTQHVTERPSRQSLVQEVVEFVELNIISGRYPAGHRLIESQIAERLKISRTPVREAFRVLAASGLLTNRTGRGAIVTGLSCKEAENLLDIRACLEDLAISVAISRISQRSLEKMRRLNDKMRDCIPVRDAIKFRELDRLFHSEILKYADNRSLEEILTGLDKKINRLRYMTLALDGEMERACAFHADLLKAILNNNIEEVRALRRQESEHNKYKLLTYFRAEGFWGLLQ